jgi:predicted TIM-barrel fold metal-dependent hydrolase
MQLYPHQMNQAIELIREHPDTPFIINHAGMFADRTLAGWRQWRDGMRGLAAHENVAVKISGLGMLDHNWTIESLRPYVLETLDAFGITRSMFASNFPVDRLFGSYTDSWRAFLTITADLTANERAALVAANAERVYRI